LALNAASIQVAHYIQKNVSSGFPLDEQYGIHVDELVDVTLSVKAAMTPSQKSN
jgi:hypothetical protein